MQVQSEVKRALLILLWTLLVVVGFILPTQSIIIRTRHGASVPLLSLLIFLFVLVMVSAPLSGWLADAKFGNYKVFIVGAVLLFISTVMNCLLLILEELVWENNCVLKWTHLCLFGSLFVAGGCACFVTALPLGLDQMPDASSSSITSYIAWFVCILFFGVFLSHVFSYITNDISGSIYLVLALTSTLCFGILLVSNFLLSPKWLIIEPKSPQSLKAIFQVLKFAAKHKAPLNRSALTYWEEDIPSRIDLGKSKYGGPFTTEQVEDVKTILRLLVVSTPLFIVFLSLTFRINGLLPNLSKHSFTSDVANFFAHSTAMYAILVMFAFEFLVCPLAKNKLPSILKRITAVPLIFTVVSSVCFFLKLASYLSYSSESTTLWIVNVLHTVMSGILSQVLLTALLEFMCAQSPYHMRGLLVSFVVPLTGASYIVGIRVGLALKHSVCSTPVQCSLISFSVKTVTCFIGFLLFCVVARWYKMRVRDEDYSPQRVVEEVYDRYLTAAAAQSRSYGTSN